MEMPLNQRVALPPEFVETRFKRARIFGEFDLPHFADWHHLDTFNLWWKPQCWQTAQMRRAPHWRTVSGLPLQCWQRSSLAARPVPCSGKNMTAGALLLVVVVLDNVGLAFWQQALLPENLALAGVEIEACAPLAPSAWMWMVCHVIAGRVAAGAFCALCEPTHWSPPCLRNASQAQQPSPSEP
jgi:hypothetical protein